MNEEVDMIKEDFNISNQKSLTFLELELKKIRTGKATPDMLDSVMVEYYGNMTELNKVANVGTLDGRTLTIQPWEKGMLSECAKGIINSNLGLNPQDNGEILIITVPMLTEERRKELSKQARSEGENTKVSIRNNRKDAMDFIKSLKNEGLSEDESKSAEEEIQNITNSFVKKVDDLITSKEKVIMTI